MANSDMTNDNEALRKDESALDAQISLCAGAAGTAVKHALDWPNVSTLAGVDRHIGLLQFFCVDAQRLKDSGRPATHARLTAILSDITAARDTLARTMGILASADRSDAISLDKSRAELGKQQKKLIDSRIDQAQEQAKEIRKIL